MTFRTCCVPGCSSREGDGITLHRFPNPKNEPERFRSWVQNSGVDNESSSDETFIFTNRRICRLHFSKVYHYPKNKLCKLAIPTENLMQGVDTPLLQNLNLVTTMEHVIAVAGTSFAATPSVSTSEGLDTPLLQNMDFKVMEPVAAVAATSSAATPSTWTSGSPKKKICLGIGIPQRASPVTRGLDTPLLQNMDFKVMEPVAAVAATSSAATPSTWTSGPPKKKICLGIGIPQRASPVTRAHCSLQSDVNKEVKKINARLRKMKRENLNLRQRLILAKKFAETKSFELMNSRLSKAAQQIFKMQISQACKKSRGRRFSRKEKILALSLFKSSPKAYRLLSEIFVLPKRKTLQSVLQQINIKPGINEHIFERLKKRVRRMPKHHRFCNIIFDEMAISAGCTYNAKNDIITGFLDDGETRESQFCDHVLVFMIRGVVKKFKQPVTFSYCAGTTKTVTLKRLLKSVIGKVQETGLTVIATVCDQGATNMAAVNSLLEETKAEYLRKGEEWRGRYFQINGKKVYPLYDPPHLLKGIRNNLLNKDLQFTMDGKRCVAKWQHLIMLFQRYPSYKGAHLAHKLTAKHVDPKLIPKMRVRTCAQVFSNTVAVTMGYMAENGKLPEEAQDTADLMLLFDRIFDSVNGSYSSVQKGKSLKAAVTPKSPHHKFWNECLPVLKSMRFIDDKNKEKVVPSITSWIKTIEGFQAITKDFHEKGLQSLLLRNFNQDPVENMFGYIRSLGNCDRMPNAHGFENHYKTLLINHLTMGHSAGANCEEDTAVRIQTVKDFFCQISTSDTANTEVDPDHLFIDLLDTQELIENKSACNLERSAAAGYCSGWLVRTAKKFIVKRCNICLLDCETTEEQPFHKYIKLKEYENKNWLCYPTRAIFDMFVQIEHITNKIIDQDPTKQNISEYVKLIITMHVDFGHLTCETHKTRLQAFFIKKAVRFFVLNWCRLINNVLHGKAQPMDDSQITRAAHTYFIKHKSRK